MRFLLRMAFWLGVILVLLPSGGSQSASKIDVSASEAMSAAGATVSDMKQFCGRQSDACTVGSQVAVALGQRAQAGAKMLYEFLHDRLGSGDPAVGKARAGASQHTLTPADLVPGWRAPPSTREAGRDRPS